MITFENHYVYGWEAAIRGMRNPMNSWEKSDSGWMVTYPDDAIPVDTDGEGYYDLVIGPNDQKLMMNLAKSGTEHSKYRRMITVTVDITAPLYWWKEFDTYKVGTVANSCSTMHKIAAKEFTLDDFSHEHIMDINSDNVCLIYGTACAPMDVFILTIKVLNSAREKFLETNDKTYWWQMIQLLPSSYNQRRTVQLNYEVLSSIYRQRKDHKLDEWHVFCDWAKDLPYSKLITMEET